MNASRVLLAALLVGAAVFFSACFHDGDPAEPACDNGGVDSGVNFEPDLAYRRLLMPFFGDKGATLRVVPGHLEASALYNKITADNDSVWFGSPMPQGKALLSIDPEAVEAIRKWIAGGTKPPVASAEK